MTTPETQKLADALNRISDQISDLRAEIGPSFEAAAWSIEVKISDLLTLAAALRAPSSAETQKLAEDCEKYAKICDVGNMRVVPNDWGGDESQVRLEPKSTLLKAAAALRAPEAADFHSTEVFTVSPEDYARFVDAIENPKPPTAALISLMRDYVKATRAAPEAGEAKPVAGREALEKISGAREYDPEDYQKAVLYKANEGAWTVDEYLADAALSAAPVSADAGAGLAISREEIARVIDPMFDDGLALSMQPRRKDVALTKADRLLALLSQRPAAEAIPADYFDKHPNEAPPALRALTATPQS